MASKYTCSGDPRLMRKNNDGDSVVGSVPTQKAWFSNLWQFFNSELKNRLALINRDSLSIVCVGMTYISLSEILRLQRLLRMGV